MDLKHILNKIKKKKPKQKILVLGEIFEDIFQDVNIVKISQEAPVMVINPKKDCKNVYLGGAGNVLNNLLSIGLNSILITLAKTNKIDFLNKKIRSKIKLINDNYFQDIKKIRYISGNKHIIRVDHEKKYILPKKYNLKIKNLLQRENKKSNLVIISDYNKGFLTNQNIPLILSIFNKENKKIFIDSKRPNLEIFKNVFVIKINNDEACNYFKIKNIYDKSEYKKIYDFLIKNNIKNLIVTTGKHGAVLFSNREYIYIRNYKQSEIYDVSGAGDTFLSYLVFGFICGLDIKHSIMLANHASFYAISKSGISSIKLRDL